VCIPHWRTDRLWSSRKCNRRFLPVDMTTRKNRHNYQPVTDFVSHRRGAVQQRDLLHCYTVTLESVFFGLPCPGAAQLPFLRVSEFEQHPQGRSASLFCKSVRVQTAPERAAGVEFLRVSEFE